MGRSIAARLAVVSRLAEAAGPRLRDPPIDAGDGTPVDTRRPDVGDPAQHRRHGVARVFTRIEDAVYIGLGVLLAGSALFLLGAGAVQFVREVVGGTLADNVVGVLDRILLILMVVEILYTVEVSFRERALVPEPFLVVGLIATVRRMLVLTAEFSKLLDLGELAFRNAMIELSVLTLTILALVASLLMLRRRSGQAVAERA